jgi:hypothetical protein
VEAETANTPVCLRIAALSTRKHNVEYKEGQKNSEQSDKLQQRSGGNVAVFFLFYRLDQAGNHNTEAKKITDVGKVNVKIPTNRFDIIKNSKARNASNQTERAIDSLENKLYCSIFNHISYPFIRS